MYQFKTLDTFYVTGRGTAHVVELYYECVDFSHLSNREVLIDGILKTVTGVEQRGIGPFKPGTKIAVTVK